MNEWKREERHALAGLVGDDHSGLDLVSSMGAGRRLHRCRRGNISILVLFFGLVFYGLAATVWNTGQVTSAKIEAQTAADAAAYSAAEWMSRAMNVTTGANMRILRNTTGITAALATIPAMIMPWFEWIRAVNQACAAPCAGPQAAVLCAPCRIAMWTFIITMEMLPMYLPFVIEVLPTFIDLPRLFINVVKLFLYERDWIAAVPYAIETQRKALEDYYDCEIVLRRGDGQSWIEPPLHWGTPLTFVVPSYLRAWWEMGLDIPFYWPSPFSNKENGWYNSEHDPTKGEGGFKWMFVGKAKKWYKRLWIISWLIGWVYGGFFHHIPASQPQFSPLEFGPFGFFGFFEQWEKYTVVAAARKKPVNRESGQPPRYPLRFMAPGLFEDPVNPVAYAQAETFNGIDGHVVGRIIPWPWRVWTTWGWQWQPRLNDGDLLSGVAADVLSFPGDPAISLPPYSVTVTSNLDQVTTH
jgi:hypothetical protein